jgi:hypothetical protein
MRNFSFPCGCRITYGEFSPCPGAQVCLEVIAEARGAMARRLAVDDLRAHLGGEGEIEEITDGCNNGAQLAGQPVQEKEILSQE